MQIFVYNIYGGYLHNKSRECFCKQNVPKTSAVSIQFFKVLIVVENALVVNTTIENEYEQIQSKKLH